MQHKLGGFFKPHIATILEETRKEMHLTQAAFAEMLGVSDRYYYDLKNAISMLSTPEFILLLRTKDDAEKLKIIHKLEATLETDEYKSYVETIDFL